MKTSHYCTRNLTSYQANYNVDFKGLSYFRIFFYYVCTYILCKLALSSVLDCKFVSDVFKCVLRFGKDEQNFKFCVKNKSKYQGHK